MIRRLLLTLLTVGVAFGAAAVPAGARTENACEVARASELCVFRRPFREADWIADAGYRVDLKYALFNYDEAVRGTCAPALPARDESGRAGWLRVVCTITLTGQKHGECDGRCTGTIWQYYGDSDAPKRRNLGATRLRFRVVFVKSQSHCGRVPRISQLPPFTPRLQPSPLNR
jgi:hypothetical protein